MNIFGCVYKVRPERSFTFVRYWNLLPVKLVGYIHPPGGQFVRYMCRINNCTVIDSSRECDKTSRRERVQVVQNAAGEAQSVGVLASRRKLYEKF